MPRSVGPIIIAACSQMMPVGWFRSRDLGRDFWRLDKYNICQRATKYGMMEYDSAKNLYRVREGWRTILEYRESKPEKPAPPKRKEVSDVMPREQKHMLAISTVQSALRNRHPLEMVWA
jgi:hypothetical protein